MKYVWLLVSVLGLASVACTRRNPAVCCVSAPDCTEISLPVGSLCQNGQACMDHACVDPECHSSSDCSGATPICRDGLCGSCDSANPCPASSPICDLDHGTCGGCGDNSACTGFPSEHLCDTSTGQCVQCFTSGDCTAATTPTCDTGVCRACKAHTDCASNACLPDGTCGTDSNVAYVSASGTANSSCTKSMPCSTFAAGLATMRPNIKVTGVVDEFLAINQSVTVVADPGTILTNSASGNNVRVVAVTGKSVVRFYDVTMSGNAHGYAIDSSGGATGAMLGLTRVMVVNNGAGVIAGPLLLEDSIVTNNVGGGVACGNGCTIRNCIIVNNGSGNTDFGGVETSTYDGVVIEFNTIANNITAPQYASGAGLHCVVVPSGLGGGTPTIRNNIIVGNLVDGCSSDYSLFDLGTPVTGHNRSGDARFKTTSGSPFGADFYRIGAQSAAIDAADPASAVPTDLDGDARPQGAGYDIGADEYKP